MLTKILTRERLEKNYINQFICFWLKWYQRHFQVFWKGNFDILGHYTLLTLKEF